MRQAEFDPSALEDLVWWVQYDRKTALRALRLFVLHKIERGLNDAEEGKTMTQAEVEAHFRWRRASRAGQ